MANSITISVIGDVKNLVSGTHEATGALGKLGHAGAAIGKTVAVGLAAAGAAFVAYGVASVKSLARIQQINTQTSTVIKSTGGAAGVTATHVENLAGKLENLTATEAESTQEGANLLLTFTNIKNGVGKGNKVFDQATTTLVDMARALGDEPQTEAVRLGKALNDPIKGVGALTKVGVSFTDQQKKTIGSLVKSGKTMGAQKVILGELNKEFGGSGKAFAGTTQGKIALAGHAFGTLGETIFSKLLPPLGQLATVAAKGLNWLAASPQVAAFAKVIGRDVKDGVQAAGAALAQLGTFVQANVIPVVIQLMPKLIELGANIQAVAGVVIADGVSAFHLLAPIVMSLAGIIVTQVIPAVVSFYGYLARNLVPIVGQVGDIVRQLIPTLAGLARFFVTQIVPAVVQVAKKIGASLKPSLDQLFATIRGSLLPALSKAVAKFEEWRPTIQKVVLITAKIIGKVLEFAAAITGKVLPVVIKFAGYFVSHYVPFILGAITVTAKIIGKVIEVGTTFVKAGIKVAQFEAGVVRKIASVLTTIAGIPARVVGAVGDLGRILYNAGSSIIQGLIDGISDKVHALTDKLGDVTKLIPKFKGPPEKDGRLLRPAGRLIIAGLIAGMTDGEDGVKRWLTKLTNTIGTAYTKGLGKNATKAELAAATRRLNVVNKAITAEVKGLLQVAKHYADLAKARKDYTAQVKASTLAYADITNVGQIGDDGEQTTQSIIQGLADRLNAIKHFTAGIAALRRKHLNKDTIASIIAAGVDGGTATLDALLADPSGIGRINGLEAAINSAAAGLGTTATNAVLDPLDPAKVKKSATRAAHIIEQILKDKLGFNVTITTDKRGRVSVDTTAPRPRVDQAALDRKTAASQPATVTVKLTAEQLSRVQRGREITLDIKAYQRAGGKP